MNLINGATFMTAMIKPSKSRFNQKIKFSCGKEWRIWEIAINNGWNTQIVQILHGKRMGVFFSKEICSADYQILLDYHMSRSGQFSSTRGHSFTLDSLTSQKTDPLKYLLEVHIHMIKNQYLMIISCTFYWKIRLLVCSVNCDLHFSSLVIKLLLIILKTKLNPH